MKRISPCDHDWRKVNEPDAPDEYFCRNCGQFGSQVRDSPLHKVRKLSYKFVGKEHLCLHHSKGSAYRCSLDKGHLGEHVAYWNHDPEYNGGLGKGAVCWAGPWEDE